MIMQPEGKTLPVLIDFGVGKLTNIVREQKQLNSDNYSYVGKMSFVGKIGYAPREQISMGICSPSSDIYALGVTALVLLTGKNPTSLVNSYSLEWEWHNYARVSQEFSEILDKMTKERPQERYSSTNEVLLDIQQKIIDCPTSIVVPTQNNESKLSKLDSILPCSPPESSATLINQENHSNENAVVDYTQPLTSKSLTNSIPANTNNIFDLSKKQQTLEPKFVQRCQKELAYFIGPMASLIIDEVLIHSASKSPEAFVNDLAEQIPDSQQAIKFKRLLLET
jgi:serine/threonine-protein kinase